MCAICDEITKQITRVERLMDLFTVASMDEASEAYLVQLRLRLEETKQSHRSDT